MTGADSKLRKSGQAMVEFLIGLVGIVFLMAGLHQIALIVDEDFDSLIGSRDEVAEDLVNGSPASGYSGAGAYQPENDFFGQLAGNILYYDEYTPILDQHKHTDSVDGFESLTGNPLADILGAQGTANIAVESSMMRRLIGSSVVIQNEVWMPPWDDLME